MNEEIKHLVSEIFIRAVKDHKYYLSRKKPEEALAIYNWVCHSRWFNFWADYLDNSSRSILRKGMLEKFKEHEKKYENLYQVSQ